MSSSATPPHGSPHVTSTSRSLLVGVRAHDAQAWERLVGLYSPLVYHWCQRLGLPRQEMADVFQEVFRSVAAHIDDFRKESPQDTFRGWLRVITRNKVRDHYRRQAKQPQAAGGTEAGMRLAQVPAPDNDVESDAAQLDAGQSDAANDDGVNDDAAEDAAFRQLFLRALELIRPQFHERTWQAFWRVVVDEKTPQEAGAELSMTPGAVRVAKSRVLARLRQELGDVLE
jgi:RNA polymerase sigma-70 factor (ECF subfamily)